MNGVTCVREHDAMAVDTEVSDQLATATRISKAANPVLAILNGLLGATWRAYAQHETHVALIEAWGLKGLASVPGADAWNIWNMDTA
jgi:hypothetical protein